MLVAVDHEPIERRAGGTALERHLNHVRLAVVAGGFFEVDRAQQHLRHDVGRHQPARLERLELAAAATARRGGRRCAASAGDRRRSRAVAFPKQKLPSEVRIPTSCLRALCESRRSDRIDCNPNRRIPTIALPCDVAGDRATDGCGCRASNSKFAASCRSCPRRASCPCGRRPAPRPSRCGRPVPWSRCGCPGPKCESDCRCRRWPALSFEEHARRTLSPAAPGSDMSLPAARQVDDVDHDVVAGRGESLAVGRERQRANPLPARRRCRAPSAPVVTFHRRIWPLRPATAIRIAVGREGDRPHVRRRAIELLRRSGPTTC